MLSLLRCQISRLHLCLYHKYFITTFSRYYICALSADTYQISEFSNFQLLVSALAQKTIIGWALWLVIVDMKEQLQLAQLRPNPEKLSPFLSHRWTKELVLFFLVCSLYFYSVYYSHVKLAYTATFCPNYTLQPTLLAVGGKATN